MSDRRMDTPSGSATMPDGPDGDGVTGLRFVVAPRAVLRVTLPIVVLLVIASTVVRLVRGDAETLDGWLFHAVPLFDVDAEGGIPAWFSALLLGACAAALWTVADDVRGRGGREHRYWRLISVIFVYLSLDEAVTLHEQAGRKIGESIELGGPLRFPWVILAIPALIVLAAVLVPFLRSLPAPTRTAFLGCAALYVGGALGLEMVGGTLVEAPGPRSVPYVLVSTAEELCEMLGTAAFLAAVAQHRRRYVVPSARGRTRTP